MSKESTVLRQVDLWKALEGDGQALIRHSDAVVLGVECIAHSCTFCVGQVWESQTDELLAVASENKHFAERVGEEVVEGITFDVVVVPALSRLSSLVDGSNELVHVTVGVHDVPQTLAIGRVIATTEALFVTIVEEGDTAGRQSEGNGVLETSHVVPLGEETGIVMVVHEGAEDVDIYHLGCFKLVVFLP